MQHIYLEPQQVPPHLRGRYSGKHLRATVREAVSIPADAGLWSGGSRDTYTIVRLSDGAAIQGSDNMSSPWDQSRRDRTVTLEPGVAVVEHTIFQGKDLGLTFYIHPSDAAAMLPAPVELSALERFVLDATKSYKSSYNGRDRYQLACDTLRWDTQSRNATPTRAQWDEAKAALIARGYLNKAGAITTSGRNAIA